MQRVFFNGIEIHVDDNRQISRSYLAQIATFWSSIIKNLRMQGQEPYEYMDNLTLLLMLKFIAHDTVYGRVESLQARRNTLFNIGHTAGLLSKFQLYSMNHGLDGKSRGPNSYDMTSSSYGYNIWDALEYMSVKFFIPRDQPLWVRIIHISDITKNSILNEMQIVARIISIALSNNQDEKNNQREAHRHQPWKDTPVIFSYVLCYKDKEAFSKLNSVFNNLDTLHFDSTYYSIFNVLQILGEALHEQHLSDVYRHRINKMDETGASIATIMRDIRNTLEHPEKSYQGISDALPSNIEFEAIKSDLTMLKRVLLPMRLEHESLMQHSDIIEKYYNSYRLGFKLSSSQILQVNLLANRINWPNQHIITISGGQIINLKRVFLEACQDFRFRQEDNYETEFRDKIKDNLGFDDIPQGVNRGLIIDAINICKKYLRATLKLNYVRELKERIIATEHDDELPQIIQRRFSGTIDCIDSFGYITQPITFSEDQNYLQIPAQEGINIFSQTYIDIMQRYANLRRPQLNGQLEVFVPPQFLQRIAFTEQYSILEQPLPHNPRLLVHMQFALANFVQYIDTKSIELVKFHTLSEELRQNPAAGYSLRYCVKSMLALNHNNHFDAPSQELRAMRNYYAHGNLYVDLFADEAGLLIRYASIFSRNLYCIHTILYTNRNLILRQDEMLHQAGQIAGMDGINRLINLGEDPEIARGIVLSAKEYGITQVLNILFSDIKPNVLSESVIPTQRSGIDLDVSAINMSTEKLETNHSWVERCKNQESMRGNCIELL